MLLFLAFIIAASVIILAFRFAIRILFYSTRIAERILFSPLRFLFRLAGDLFVLCICALVFLILLI